MSEDKDLLESAALSEMAIKFGAQGQNLEVRQTTSRIVRL